MARHYHIDIAAFAADADQKWVDNLLSHFDVPGVEAARQGVARRISTHGIYHIALARIIAERASASAGVAVDLAARLLITDATRVSLGPGVSLVLDREAFERGVDARIAEAVESIVPARRGRPPAR
jgi:hypothetical protein